MNKIFSLFIALIKNWLRSRSGVFFSILFPLMLLIIFSTVFGGQGSVEYDLYIQNNDVIDGEPTNISESFITALDSTNTFDIKHIEPGVDVYDYGEESSFESYRVLVIPEGFQESALNKSMSVRAGVMKDTLVTIENIYGENMNDTQREELASGKDAVDEWQNYTEGAESAEILLLASEGDQGSQIVQGITYSVVSSFNSEMIGVEDSTVEIETDSIERSELEAVDYYLPAYIAAFIMTNGIIGITSNVSEYKRNGTLKRLAATPLTKRDYILASILQQAVLAFFLTSVMVVFAIIVFDVHIYPNFLALVLIFLGSIAFSSVGMVLGGLIKDVEAASGAGNAIAFPMMFLSGAFWPIENMPEYLQTVAKFLPLYYFHQGLRSMMILESMTDVWISFAVIGSFALVFTVIAIFVTKWKEL